MEPQRQQMDKQGNQAAGATRAVERAQSSLESARASRHQRSSCTWACGLSLPVGVA